MQLSNSAVEAYYDCPTKFANRYIAGWKQATEPAYFAFGQRIHDLLQEHYCGVVKPSGLSAELEAEAQAVLAAYQASYSVEPFDVVDCEVAFELVVGDANFTGRIDMVVRDKVSGRLQLFESKTESRGSKRNLPQAWTARHQGSYYVHAASILFDEPVDTVILNVITKSSPGKQIGPGFRRDSLHRSPQQVEQALRDLQYVAGQASILGTNPDYYPRATNHCVSEKGWACEYYGKCHLGDTSSLTQIAEPFAYQEK